MDTESLSDEPLNRPRGATSVAPVLEAAIVLELVLHNVTEAAVIASLLVFNAGIGFYQEGKAHATLVALKSRLVSNASVRANGKWVILA